MNKTKPAMEIGQRMLVKIPITYRDQVMPADRYYQFKGMTADGLEMVFENGAGEEYTLLESAYYGKVERHAIVPPRPRATAAMFFALCEAGKAKITPPQAEIYHALKEGWKIWIVNTHHASGGQWAWKRPGQERPEYAGKVYKAFWGLIRNVLYENGFEETAPADFFHEEEWRGEI
jgi:hypothetical protein